MYIAVGGFLLGSDKQYYISTRLWKVTWIHKKKMC